MSWSYPPHSLYQNAMQMNPTQAITAGQAGNAPGVSGMGSNVGFANQSVNNQKNTNVPSPGLGGVPGSPAKPADPSSFGTSSYAYNSPQWYGKGNEYGSSVMADNPAAFWGGYAEDQMGMAPGSNAASFLAGKYNIGAIGDAMYGKGFVSDDQRLAGMTSMANAINGPGTTFFNPGVLIGSVLQALQKGDVQSLAKINPNLQALVAGAVGDPVRQVGLLTDFFKQLLSATMPPDVLSAFINQINQLGQVWFSQMRKDPNMSALDSGTFARFLTQTLGPTLGL